MEKRIVEGIEACRPGSQDLQSSELGDVARQLEHDPQAQAAYERVQQWDTAISSAMEDVPLPVGLAGRLLARLQENAPASTAPLATPTLADEVLAPAATVELPPERRGWSRRHWLSAATALAGSLLLAVFLNHWLRPPDSSPLEAMAESWQRELGAKWQEMKQSPPDLAIPSVIMATPAGWQRIVGKYAVGRVGGVAYKLANAKGETAILFVMRLSQPDLSKVPPVRPSNTGGKATAYWQANGRVYVLVVESESSYRSFVSVSPTPLA